jgi:hypothetical protein
LCFVVSKSRVDGIRLANSLTVEAAYEVSPASEWRDAISRRECSKIGGDQIVRTSASAHIKPGRGGTYQITVGIECVQKARLIGSGIRLNSPQSIFIDEK